MTVLRMDHVVVVVDDLPAAIAFCQELGLETEGQMPIEGRWVERINRLDGLKVDIVMMRTPDGSGKLELTRFRHPPATGGKDLPPNTLGLRSVMFEVDDVADMVKRLERHGGQLVGEIADYEDVYRLCYLRGPGGAIFALAQKL